MSEKDKKQEPVCDQGGACEQCEHANLDGSCKKGIDPLDDKVSHNLSHIRNRLLILSGKGGVGKSTVSANLAVVLARRGYRVGLMDVDLHGPSIPGMLGLSEQAALSDGDWIQPLLYEVDGSPEAKPLRVVSISFFLRGRDEPVIWRGPMKHSAIKQFIGQVLWGPLDFLLVDSPPGTGDEPLSIAQTIPGAKAVVVTTPQDVSLSDVRRSINFCRSLKMEVLGVIENMSGLDCPHCGGHIDLFKSGGGEKMAQEMNVPFLGRLPIDPAIVIASDEGRPLGGPVADDAKADDSRPAVGAFERIVDEVVARSDT